MVHDDRIGYLRLPRGPYLITAFGSVSCAQASTQFTSFLDNDYTGIRHEVALPIRLEIKADLGPGRYVDALIDNSATDSGIFSNRYSSHEY